MNPRVVIPLLVVAAVAAGFYGKRWFDGRNGAAPAVTPAAVSEPSPGAAATAPAEDAAPRKVVPDTLPGFALQDRDGKPRRLTEWSGRPLVVNFWATWCPPCRREIPLLNRLRVKHAAQNVEIVGIAVDFRADVLAYAAREKISYPLLIGEEDGLQAVAALGMEPAFPFTVFCDSQQRIVAVKVGELHEDEAQLILAAVERVDRGSLALEAAKIEISEGLKGLAAKRATTPEPGATTGAAG